MNEHELWRFVGILVGFLVGLLLTFVLAKLGRRKLGEKCNYDERQQIVRGKGCQYGFFTMLIGCGILTCLGEFIHQFVGYPIMIFAIICISVLVTAIYCIMNEGYYAVNDNPTRINMMLAIVGLINLVLGICGVLSEDFSLKDAFPSGMLNLICAGLLFFLVVVLIVKNRMQKGD